MEFDIFKASDSLSKLDITLSLEHAMIDILWFRVMKNTKDWCINRHRHSSYEFHFVAGGGSKVILDDNEFDVYTGDFYIASPGIYHNQTNNDCSEYIEYSLNCDINPIDEITSEEKHLFSSLSSVKCIPYKNAGPILNIFETALEEAFYKNIGYYNKIKTLVMLIIIETARAINSISNCTYEAPMKYKKYDYRYIQIERFISDNITSKITAADVADYMHLSIKQLSRIIYNHEGISTKEYICRLKFQKAKEMLINTQYSISSISEALDFSSQYYFNQFFKRLEGYSPGEFRKNVQNV